MKKNKKFITYNFDCFVFFLKTVFRTRKSLFLITLLCSLLGAAMQFIWAFFFKYLLDNVESDKYEEAVICAVTAILANAVMELLLKLLNIAKSRGYFHINSVLRKELSKQSYEIPFDKLENADTINQFELAFKFVNRNYMEKYTDGLTNIISCIFVFLGVTFATSYLQWWISLFLLVVITINTICHVWGAQCEVEQFNEETAVSRQLEYTRFWLSEKSRAKEVRTYVLYSFVVGKLKEYNEQFFELLQSFTQKSKKSYIVIQIANAVQLFVLYAYCAVLFAKGGMSAGDFLFITTALISFGGSLTSILYSLIDLYKNNIYIEKLKTVLKMETRSGCERYSFPVEKIEFCGVSFRYPGAEKDAIHNVSFSVNAGEKISLIGENGAGKSTLVKLLAGFYTPTEGEILINSQPMDLESKNYLPLFSVVFQDYTMFNFSVSENVAMNENGDKDIVRALLEQFGLFDLDPNIYITRLFNDEGTELSGGENQKVAFARALYKNSQILILDEPTSALSPQSEYEIYKNFKKMTNNKTVFFISHRLSSCRICDKILLLNGGQLLDYGSHEQLLKSSELYCQMFNAQAELYAE